MGRICRKESDECDKSIEPIGEVPLVLGESELNRLVHVDGEKPGVDSRDEGSILEGRICYSQFCFFHFLVFTARCYASHHLISSFIL